MRREGIGPACEVDLAGISGAPVIGGQAISRTACAPIMEQIGAGLGAGPARRAREIGVRPQAGLPGHSLRVRPNRRRGRLQGTGTRRATSRALALRNAQRSDPVIAKPVVAQISVLGLKFLGRTSVVRLAVQDRDPTG